MHHPKSDKERPTAREQAAARRAFDMSTILGMGHTLPIVIEPEEKVPVPAKVSE